MIIIYNDEIMKYEDLPKGTYTLDNLPLINMNKYALHDIMTDLANIYKCVKNKCNYVNTQYATSLNYFIVAHHIGLYIPCEIGNLLQIEMLKKICAHIAHCLYLHYEVPISLKFNKDLCVKSSNYIKLPNSRVLNYYLCNGRLCKLLKKCLAFVVYNDNNCQYFINTIFSKQKRSRNLCLSTKRITFSNLKIE